MKSTGIRLVANLVLWIGTIACLLGCIVALLLANGNPLGMPTEYVPDFVDFIHIGFDLLVVIVVAIVLHAVANAKEKKAKIRACWAAGEAAAAELPNEEPVVEETAVEEIVEDAPVEETEEVAAAEEPVAEKPLAARVRKIRATIVEKTPLSEEQLAKVEKVAKIAVPVGAVCVAFAMMSSKLAASQKKAARRQSFYHWLG